MSNESAYAILGALPLLSFLALFGLERWRPLGAQRVSAGDWLLNGSGLLIQGALIPVLAVALGGWLATALPAWDGVIPGVATAFLLNVIGLDLLYYLQHRWFHAGGWALHRTHHSAASLGAWVTARNTLAVQPLFVYLIPAAVLSLLCADKLAWFAGAMLTASLDLWRHSAVRWPARWDGAGWLARWVLITPSAHHLHHAGGAPRCNFGANLTCWDRLFGTYREAAAYPLTYGIDTDVPAWRQLLVPWRL